MNTLRYFVRNSLRALLLVPALALIASQTVLLSVASAQILSQPADTDSDGVPDSQETHDGTRALSADSLIEHVSSTYCVNWNGFLNSNMQVMELRNAGCSTLTLQISLRDSAGTVQDTFQQTLTPTQQFDVVANILNGFQPMSYGTLCAVIQSGDPDTLDVRMSTYRPLGGSFASGFSVPSSPARSGPQFLGYNNLYPTLNALEFANGVDGWIQVSNDESTAQTGELVYYNIDGVEIRRTAIAVAARGRIDADTHTLGQSMVGAVEWRPSDSTKKFRLVLNRYYFSGGPGSSYIGAIAIPARRPNGSVLASSFQTDSRFAVLELNNTLSIGIAVSLSVYNAAGSLTQAQPGPIYLPAKATHHIILNNYLSSGIGKVEFSSDQPQSLVGAVLEYGLDSSNRFTFATAGEPKAGLGVTQRSSYNNFFGGCRLRLTNLTATARSTQVAVNRLDGTAIPFTTPVQIPADGLIELDLCASDVPNNYGGVILTPSSGETLIAEVIRENAGRTAEIKTTAAERSICSAGLTLNTPSVSLVASSGTPDTISITNNSTVVIATNIQAVLPSGWNDVIADVSNCATLPPGASCAVSVTPGSMTHAAASVSIVGNNTTEVLPIVAVSAAPIAILTVTGSPLTLITNGATGSLTINNTSLTTTALNVASSFTGTALDGLVTETGNTCASIAPSSSCTLTYTPGGTAVSQTSFSIQGSNTNTVTGAIAVVPPAMTTLSTSVSTLALSITGYTEFGVSGTPSSGVARIITITNTGINTAFDVAINFPTWPTGTTASSTCGSTLTAASSCTITVTPGSVATSDGTDPSTVGTVPIPGVVSVNGSNTNSVTTDVVVIGYGTIWQGGYVFALDDTLPNTGSVGGKVMTTADQAPPFPSGIIWSSNGNGPTSGDTAFDAIYGISEISTTFSPNPSSGQVAGQTACNGNTDGLCNTNNIYVYYNVFTFPPINPSFYATGLCKATISGYSDWYLPAICEMGTSSGPGCGSAATPTLQNIQGNLVDLNSLNLVAGIYYSSTEESIVPNATAYVQLFASSGGSDQLAANKFLLGGVRCVRSLS